jgi:hypothetical protein
MFQRIRDVWRHLVGGGEIPQAGGAGVQEEDDRRVWVRHPSSAEAVVRADNGINRRLPARVRDVSRGGLNLVLGRRVEPGDLISIELPGGTPESVSTVLACVAHVSRLGEKEWGVGCSFCEQLGDADLAAFGARRERPAAPDDLRNWVRFPCNVKALCQRVGDPTDSAWPAQVVNVSPNGIGLLVDRAVETGALLSVSLESPTTGAARTILACVVHATTRPGNECNLGCSFIREFSEEDLEALL